MKYAVQLTYPRASRQPVYADLIEAETKELALIIAEFKARKEGWTGSPLKREARIQRSQEET